MNLEIMKSVPDWDKVMNVFRVDRSYVQLGASQFLVSHPLHIREAIEKYSRALDAQPVLYTEEEENRRMQAVREAAASYLGVSNPDEIAVTDSTTMGLGLIYTALNTQKGQEIITTDHDHYSQHESIRQAAARTGASVKRIRMYKDLSSVTKEEMVASVVTAISEQTRVIGLTWVHSSSGLKIPVAEITSAIRKINADRSKEDRIIVILDGVHGLGIEKENFEALGCDFLISGCHKWLYGPRGTGIIVATHDAWQRVTPVVPSFTEVMDMVIAEEGRPPYMDGKQMTPGGFHSLEYRWALADAFDFMMQLGKERVCERVHQLNRMCKEGLAAMGHVKLHTPMDDGLSSGIISFEVDGIPTEQVVDRLKAKKVIATAAPYKTSWVRFTPGLLNNEDEIRKGLDAVASLKR